eukprot:scaffold5640_cov328-Prasinococcus_capsulatus_cf.AAC.3
MQCTVSGLRSWARPSWRRSRWARGGRARGPLGAWVEEHRLLVRRHPPVRQGLLVRRVGGGALGAEQQTFLRSHLNPGLHDTSASGRKRRAQSHAHPAGRITRAYRFDVRVVHGDTKPATLIDGADDQKVPHGHGHADACRDGVRVLPEGRVLVAALPGAHDRRAARGLHGHHAWALGADPPERLELRERLPHADEARAAAAGVEDHVGHPPAQLLGQLQAHGLLALDAVGLLERAAVKPAHGLLALAHDLAAVVDEAVHAIHGGALQLDLAHVHLRGVRRAEDGAAKARACGVGRHSGARVAVGGHGQVLQPELLGHCHSQRQPARLEGPRGQPALVLHQQPATPEGRRQAVQRDQRRRHLTQRQDVAGARHRQQLAVAPKAAVRARGELVSAQVLGHRGQVVAHQQRTPSRG